MKIVETINDNQMVIFEDLYYDYFKSLNLEDLSDRVLRNFARRKMKDYKKGIADSKYMFAVSGPDVVGFVYGKFFNNSGKICHVYGKDQNTTLNLLWELANWYKQQGITDLELYSDESEIFEVQYVQLEENDERINRSK